MTFLWRLLLLSPALVWGLSLDFRCGQKMTVYTSADTYSVNDASRYKTPCKIRFQRYGVHGEIRLTVSGFNLLSSQCQVSIYDYFGNVINSGANIIGYGFFSKEFQSTDGTGQLRLRVTGTSCSAAGLQFTVKKIEDCLDFTCNNGHCVPEYDVCDDFDDCGDGSDESDCFVWTTGKYVGVSVGVFVFVCILSAIGGVTYRRRVVYRRTTPGNQTLVTQTRW